MALTQESQEIIEKKAELIYRDDSILSIVNDKFVERYMFFNEANGLFYVKYYIFDNHEECCHYEDGDVFDVYWKAENFYNSILDLLEGEVFIYGQ